jgi:hypothetical protein
MEFLTEPRKSSSTKETKAEREARAKALFTKASVQFLGNPNPDKLNEVEYKKAGKCLLCGGTHKLEKASLTSFFQFSSTKLNFALSDSCREIYFEPLANLSLTNPELYRKFYKGPVKK